MPLVADASRVGGGSARFWELVVGDARPALRGKNGSLQPPGTCPWRIAEFAQNRTVWGSCQDAKMGDVVIFFGSSDGHGSQVRAARRPPFHSWPSRYCPAIHC